MDSRIWRAHFHPRFQIRDLFSGKFFVFRRHLQIFIRVTNRFDKKTRLRISGNNGGASIAAFKNAIFGIKQQSAFYFLTVGAVAFVTIVDKQRADFTFEKFKSSGFGRRSNRGEKTRQVTGEGLEPSTNGLKGRCSTD